MNPLINTFGHYLRKRYPFRVRKLTVHTGLGCPHRKDRTGSGGCVYCNESGFSTISGDANDSEIQIREGIQKFRKTGFNGKFIVYFQTGTNTFGELSVLESQWRAVEPFREDVIGVSVGTRPDCVSESVLQILSALDEDWMIWLELGLQSAHDRTLDLINRGHGFDAFREVVSMTEKYPRILTAVHVILGLPGESEADMRFTLETLNRMPVHGLKIHHLQVVKDTVMEGWYREGKIRLFSEKEYISLLCRLLPHIRRDLIIHRLAGDIRDDLLVAPRWTMPKTRIIQEVERCLADRRLAQGDLHEKC
ncbi:MAG TPA: TIGR01212 family radical SAM protein [bacterium]|nr:TIGR01212 family radical SAM protein [bacterium]